MTESGTWSVIAEMRGRGEIDEVGLPPDCMEWVIAEIENWYEIATEVSCSGCMSGNNSMSTPFR